MKDDCLRDYLIFYIKKGITGNFSIESIIDEFGDTEKLKVTLNLFRMSLPS